MSEGVTAGERFCCVTVGDCKCVKLLQGVLQVFAVGVRLYCRCECVTVRVKLLLQV